LTVSRTKMYARVRSGSALKWRRRSQAGSGRSRSASSVGSNRPRRTSTARSTTCSQAARTPSGSGATARLHQPGELLLDQAEVLLRKLVQVALEGQRPALGRPLADVFEAVGESLGRHPVHLLGDEVGADVHTPRIILVAARRA